MNRVVQQFNSVGLVVSLQLWPVDSSVANVDLSLNIEDCRDFLFDQQVYVGFYLRVGAKVNLCVTYFVECHPTHKVRIHFPYQPINQKSSITVTPLLLPLRLRCRWLQNL